MKMNDILKLSEAELKKLVLSSKEELFKLRFQKAGGNLNNSARFKQVRKTVARALFAISAQQKNNVRVKNA